MKNSRFRKPALLLALVLFSSVFVQAKDQWIQVRSKNFFLIGNASEKDIRKVGTRLEQFRETFRQVFGSMNFSSSIPTNVVVFKASSSYKPFKPKRADGTIDQRIAGYFQPGEDVNYITLSTEGEDAQVFGTIFHEYVHFLVNINFGKSVPPWFNEGLAEYYQTFEIVDDQKVKMGLAPSGHHQLLRVTKLFPLDTLFGVRSGQLDQYGGHSRTIFYAQSWALIHYLIEGGKSASLSKFLSAVLRNVPAETAFRDAFQTTYAQMEIDLRKYISQSQYPYTAFTLRTKLVFDSEMEVAPLDEAAANAYLGDLLYHIQREGDAEAYLLTAIRLDPASSMANTTLGMVKLRQRKFDDARTYLEKGIATDPKNHVAYYRYAYLLSRESQDEFGLSRSMSTETATKMRDALRKAIALNPAFTESHDLLAFVSLVSGEGLDEALKAMQAAHKLQPGNQRYAMRIAEIHMRQNNLSEAAATAEKIAKTTDDVELRQRAELLARSIRDIQAINAQRAAMARRGASIDTGQVVFGGTPTDPPMTNEEIGRFGAESRMRTINEMLRVSKPDEKREIGRVQKVECWGRPIVYTIKTAGETYTLTSRDFAALELNTFVEAVKSVQVGCDEKLAALNALISYRPSTARGNPRGELVAIEFVPDDFRIMSAAEMRQPPPRIVSVDRVGPDGAVLVGRPPPEPVDAANARREAVLRAIKNALRQPAEGEKRDIGYLERIECTSKGAYFHLRTATGTIRLLNPPPNGPDIRVFTPDLAGMRFGCMTSPVEYPTVFIYKDTPDAKAKTAGTIVALDFVPKSFVLD